MIRINYTVDTRKATIVGGNNLLGYNGEHESNNIYFYMDKFIKGVAELKIERNSDKGTLELTNVNDSYYTLPVKRSLLTEVGKVKAQLKITTAEGEIYIFEEKELLVNKAIEADTTIPEDYPSWIDTANQKLAEFEEAQNKTNELVETLEQGIVKMEENLGKIEQGLNDINDAVDKANDAVENIQTSLDDNLKQSKDYTNNAISRDFKDISYDKDTAVFTFTRHDNTTFVVDLPIEQTVKDGRYDSETKELVLVLVSGQEIRIPATSLIDVYTGSDSATIQLVVDANNNITANIKAGTISKTLLTTELQEEIDNKVNKTDVMSGSKLGIGRVSYSYGIYANTDGVLYIDKASENAIKNLKDNYHAIVPSNLVLAVKTALNSGIATYDEETETLSINTN